MNTTAELLLLGAVHPLAANLLGVLASVLLFFYLDRLNQLRWRTHQWRVVGMHLAWALWLVLLSFDGLVHAEVSLYNLFALLGAWLWLSLSRPTWRAGPPEYTQSAPGALADEAHHHQRAAP